MLLNSLPVTPPHSSSARSPQFSVSSSLPLNSILPLLKSTKTLEELKPLHALAIKSGKIRDPLVSAEILRCSALSDDRDLTYARLVFDQMPEPNNFSWNILIRALAEREHDQFEAIGVFSDMLNCDYARPNQHTYPSVLKACASASANLIDTGKVIHGQVVKLSMVSNGFVLTNLVRMYSLCGDMKGAEILVQNNTLDTNSEASVVVSNVLIDGYFRLGMVDRARQIFDEMPNKSIVSWNGMIARYAQIGQFKKAVEVFRNMQFQGMKPNYVSLVSVLPAISRLGLMELGKWVHLYAQKKTMSFNNVLTSAIIDMYSKCGNIDKAIEVFEELPEKKCITIWTALIMGLAIHGRAKDAVRYFEMMEKYGVVPTDVAFIGVLNACSHAGLVNEGRLLFDRMVNVYNIRPRIEHYTCMVDMLGRAGLVSEAEKVVNLMPIEPDDVIFKSLLSACKLHREVEIATRVADRLLQLAPTDGGCYVLLSNFYASLGDWDAVARVRLKMKELDIRKDPGCSWITIDGNIHEFLVEDKTHPRQKEIYHILSDIASRLKDEGYVADTSQVLINIDEHEEKENMLLHHSEKIAIAFGLISTKAGTTLQVVKNLRVCVDCHSSIKLISKLYNRRIVLRDRNRFHHFENGSCSCNDYW
ncbi:pentatricopeptide repeat (PPR) superfamily protein [Carex rostrata]